jgi:hypothetical protein
MASLTEVHRSILHGAVLMPKPLRSVVEEDDSCCGDSGRRQRDTAVDAVLRLLDAGLIDILDAEERRIEVVTRELLCKGIDLPGVVAPDMWYRLTARGGLCWEGFAKPDWEQYMDIACWDDNDQSGAWIHEYASVNRRLIAEAWAIARLTYEIPPPQIMRRIVERPWSATYWKTLPRGIRLLVRVCPPFPNDDPLATIEAPKWHDDPLG